MELQHRLHYKKGAKRLYQGAIADEMVANSFYCTVIRSVLEYGTQILSDGFNTNAE
jgi:hypothetical protein